MTLHSSSCYPYTITSGHDIHKQSLLWNGVQFLLSVYCHLVTARDKGYRISSETVEGLGGVYRWLVVQLVSLFCQVSPIPLTLSSCSLFLQYYKELRGVFYLIRTNQLQYNALYVSTECLIVKLLYTECQCISLVRVCTLNSHSVCILSHNINCYMLQW